MADKDYYKILGVSKESSSDEIKKAFRQLARKHHPDVNPGNKESESKFKEINEAFQILGNPDKKAQFDQYGSSAFNPQDLRGGYQEGFGFDDLFGDIFNIFNGRRGNPDYEEGADLRYDMEISLEDAFYGVKETIQIPIKENCKKCKGLGAEEKNIKICDKCQGSGEVRVIRRDGFAQFVSVAPCDKCRGTGHTTTKPCDVCKGKGQTEKKEKIEVKIPKGVNSGQYLRVSGKGEPGLNAPSGDLYVIIHVKKHSEFKREDENLLLDKTIDIAIAIFGGEIDLIGIDDKKLKLKIPAGTQSHTPFRLEGQGMHSLESSKRGDLFVRILVDVPKLDKEKEKMFRNLMGN